MNVTELKEYEDLLKSNPNLLEFVKQLAWNAVRGCALLRKKQPDLLVRRSHSDDFIDVELGIKDPDKINNPYI